MPRFGDTPIFGQESLCKSCRCAHIVSGIQDKDTRVLCRFGQDKPILMHQPILKCTEYENREQPALWEMEKVAWRLLPGSTGKHAGFMTPGEFKAAVKRGKAEED